jgi:hypothetical protein
MEKITKAIENIIGFVSFGKIELSICVCKEECKKKECCKKES